MRLPEHHSWVSHRWSCVCSWGSPHILLIWRMFLCDNHELTAPWCAVVRNRNFSESVFSLGMRFDFIQFLSQLTCFLFSFFFCKGVWLISRSPLVLFPLVLWVWSSLYPACFVWGVYLLLLLFFFVFGALHVLVFWFLQVIVCFFFFFKKDI